MCRERSALCGGVVCLSARQWRCGRLVFHSSKYFECMVEWTNLFVEFLNER